MGATEHYGNRRPRVQKLVSAWNQGSFDDADSEGEADDALIGASAEPKKRPRTRLTDSEVDAMRTARERRQRERHCEAVRGSPWHVVGEDTGYERLTRSPEREVTVVAFTSAPTLSR